MVLEVFPFTPWYIIPVAGMLVGCIMSVTGVTMKKLREDVDVKIPRDLCPVGCGYPDPGQSAPSPHPPKPQLCPCLLHFFPLVNYSCNIIYQEGKCYEIEVRCYYYIYYYVCAHLES